ncbi:enoyl-CoA hydratase/isomerase family protein [Sneathiella chinensis]|uniref:3-hydroxybutyryl-CoA dehydratase n=1 Tax=Sneathiella chinensis TaxID=349750 RepID=A0ABQ5U088_9PROT|nr:enoyl-CoA hydratase-related protein [Sneathiella chinensis]GLQ05243.1 3-hydroxybutyryl-CoA dehydratase [Sneathiella chinensis]
MTSFFSTKRDDSVLTITLDKPKQHNVLNPEEMAALQQAFEQAAEDAALRVVVLTGEGRSFCAGANLGELGDYDFGANPLENLTNAIEATPVPVICSLNGGVYGGGTDLALACDFRIGVESMKCFVPPARIGIHYHPTGMVRAVSRLGLGPAKRLFLALETMSAAELKTIGFLDYLVKDEDLAARTASLAADIAKLAPLSIRGMKATLNDIARYSFDEAAAREAQLACLKSEDFKEGQAALAEKRPAKFTGK